MIHWKGMDGVIDAPIFENTKAVTMCWSLCHYRLCLCWDRGDVMQVNYLSPQGNDQFRFCPREKSLTTFLEHEPRPHRFVVQRVPLEDAHCHIRCPESTSIGHSTATISYLVQREPQALRSQRPKWSLPITVGETT